MDCWSSSTIFIKLRSQQSSYYINTHAVSHHNDRGFWACVRPSKIPTHYGYVLRFSEIAAGAYNASVSQSLATPTPIVLDYQNTKLVFVCLRRQRFRTFVGSISSPNQHDNPRCGALPAMLDLYIKPRPRTILPPPTHLFAHYQNNDRHR